MGGLSEESFGLVEVPQHVDQRHHSKGTVAEREGRFQIAANTGEFLGLHRPQGDGRDVASEYRNAPEGGPPTADPSAR